MIVCNQKQHFVRFYPHKSHKSYKLQKKQNKQLQITINCKFDNMWGQYPQKLYKAKVCVCLLTSKLPHQSWYKIEV